MATVTAKVTAMTTATTPPMIAAVLSDCGVIVAVLSGVIMGVVTEGLAGVRWWITKGVDDYGTAAIHIQKVNLVQQ